MFINIRFRKDKKVISYNKLWHQIIDKNLKKPIYVLNQELAAAH